MQPGLVASNSSSHGDGAMQSYMSAKNDLTITPEEAADTLIWLALAEVPGETTGEYFHNRDVIAASDAAIADDAAARLWQASEQLVARSLEK